MPVNTTTSVEVPGYLPVAIGGRTYLIDPAGFARETVPVLRTQADQSGEPGEASLNPKGLWRRSQESYHHGAGQLFLDGKDSDRARFRASKGIDPWVEGKVTLLNEVVQRRASTNTNLAVLSTFDADNNRIWVIDGNEVYYETQPLNLLSDNTTSIETDASGWTAGADTIVARSTAQAATGLASLTLARTSGSGTVSAFTPTGTSGVPVTPLRQYGMAVDKRLASGTTTAVLNPYVRWYTSAGALISTVPSTPAAFSLTSGTWSTGALGSASLISPPNAAYASVLLEVTGAGPSEVFHFDDIQFTLGSTVLTTPAWRRPGASGIHAGQAVQTPTSMATNGSDVWVALGTSGLHRAQGITATADVPAAPAGGNIGLVGYANGRLMAAGSATSTTARSTLWEIINPLSAPALGNGTLGLLWTHANSGFDITFISTGRNVMYMGGNTGGNAEIYRIGINPTDTSLTAPTFASYLPDGETIHALIFYAGGVVMGTGRGVRCATVDGQGNLDYGPLIETSAPVRCLEPQGRYVWFGWTNYDASSTGLGRLDLGYFTAPLIPAYATDLMAVGQGDVVGVCTFQRNVIEAGPEQRIFAVSGLGFYGEDTAKAASGTIETGGIRYSTTERKTTRTVDFRHHVLDGTVAADIKIDEGAYASIGSNATQGSAGPAAPLSTANAEGETAEVRFTLSRPTDGRQATIVTTAGSATITSTDAVFTAADVGRGIVEHHSITRLAAESRIASVSNATTAMLNKVATFSSSGMAVISSPLLSPDLVRWTLKALPIPRREETFTLPIIMKTAVVAGTGDGVDSPLDIEAEMEFLKGLEQAGTLVELQIGEETFTVFIDLSQFKGEYWNEDRTQLEGIYTVQCQTVAS